MSKPVFLVTGGSRGIGEAIARRAAAAGYCVLLTYVARAESALAVVDSIRADGGDAHAVQADTGKPADIAKMFAAADQLGDLAVLCYNGGLTGGVGLLTDQTDENLAEVVTVNLTGAMISAREAAKRMSTRLGGKGGAIVLLSSRAAGLGAPKQNVWYAASKGGLDSLTIGLGAELAAEGVRVNAVSPGPIATEIHPPGRLDSIRAALPMQREGQPHEVADAVMYLASDRASYVAGANILVAGGR